ncbi:Uncharacterized protein ALO65_05550 [Pseudomonas syringae pv. papulans]|nr:Uncharacterized protein ALO65_05550 [Pseudomonas syringae pv. papulans]RMV37668.1 hypothetical protein ALP11_05683 [Pseudomonas syringae pv. papulans]
MRLPAHRAGLDQPPEAAGRIEPRRSRGTGSGTGSLDRTAGIILRARLLEQRIQGLFQSRNGNDLQTGRRLLWRVALGHDGAFEAVLGGLLEALLPTGHGPDFTRQPHLTEHQQVMRQRTIAQAGHYGCHQGQVGCGFQHLHPTYHVEKHVLVVSGNAAVAVQNSQQHGQTILIQTQRHAARVGHVTVVHQRLHLHQHRPRAFPGRHDHTARHFFLRTGKKDRRRIGDFFQALVGHAEHAQLVDRAKAVLHRPQQAQAPVRLALEIQHGVDHVLKHARTGQGAFLGDVTDQEDRRAALLGVTHQQGSAFANLRHAAGGRLQLFGENRLDRIDHHHLGLLDLGGGNDGLDAGFGHYPQLVLRQSQTTGTHGDLLLGFLTGDVQRGHALGNVAQRLQEDRGLADAGVTADQHHRTINQTAAEHPVQLGGVGGEARNLFDTDLRQGPDLRLGTGPAGTPGRRRGGTAFNHGFDQCVPGTAFAALARPLGKCRAALGAAVQAFGLGHDNPSR